MIDYKSAGLTEEDLKKIYKWMDLGRKTDERLWLLNRAGKIPFVVSGQGQEATQIGMAYAMQKVISHHLIIVILAHNFLFGRC